MTGLFIFLGLGSIVLIAGFAGHRLDKKRTAALESVIAPQLGLDFVKEDTTGLQAGFAGFNLFSRGRGARRIRNIAYGRLDDDDVEVMLFDYQYTAGTGKNRTTYHQTVAFIQSDRLHLPEFVARPEGMFDKIGQVFGYQDIDLPMHPDFSRRYILRGADEAAIRDFFKPAVARFFEDNRGLSLEAKSDRFIIYRPGKRLKPEQWPGWLDAGMKTCNVFRGI